MVLHQPLSEKNKSSIINLKKKEKAQIQIPTRAIVIIKGYKWDKFKSIGRSGTYILLNRIHAIHKAFKFNR